MSRTNGKNGGGKGTYGRLSSGGHGGGKKQQPRRRSSGGQSDGGRSGKKARTNTTNEPERSKKRPNKTPKRGNKPPGASSWSLNDGNMAGKCNRNSIKGGNNKRNGKAPPPKAKHHAAKPARSSIKERVASASAARKNGKKGPPSKSASSRPKPAKRKSAGGRKKKKAVHYRMKLAECNDDVYLQRCDVPWYDAEKEERFRDNAAFDDGDGDASEFAAHRGEGDEQHSDDEEVRKQQQHGEDTESLQLPSEAIMRQIDAELRSFGAYVRLTPSERKARNAFLDHVSELAAAQFNNNTRGSHIRFNGEETGRGRGMRGSKSTRRNSGTKDDGEEMIHVAPFGSFATQAVATFASDVDMCLWGVVEGAQKPPEDRGVQFVGGEDSDDNDDGDYDFTTQNGCPLLTESALLRTMDAIQSAQSQRSGKDGSVDASKASKPKDAAVKSDDCLFFIDRVGEGDTEAEDTTNAEVIDLSAPDEQTPSTQPQPQESSKREDAAEANDGKHDDKEQEEENAIGEPNQKKVKAAKKAIAPSRDFQFVIDTEGVKELGGEADEVAESPKEEQPTAPAEGRAEASPGKDEHPEATKAVSENAESPTTEEANEPKAGQGDFEPGTFSALGKSAQDVIDVNDDSSEGDKNEVIVVDSDDGSDSADPMSSYYNREETKSSALTNGEVIAVDARASPINLLDDDSSDNDDDSDASPPRRPAQAEIMELSLTSNKSTTHRSVTTTKPTIGPTGKARVKVISALQSLTRHLRRSSFTHTIECRSKARVPIINCGTRTGFEGDIAVGGHNGVDTSTYAMSQVERFRSFAPIVLLLKILMEQQGLDKPFTGGLGSYKLYVLVAYHIERHTAKGGIDRPAEILVSLLFRYGCLGSRDDEATTDLEHLKNTDDTLSSDGGLCDLSNIFRLGDCVDMFRECHARLYERILIVDDFGGDREKISYLSSIIDCYRLRTARETSDRRAKLSDTIICRPTPRDHPGKVSSGRRVGKVFSKSDGHYPKRGPRGGLIPRTRPDLSASRALRGSRETDAIQRGTKNRKNKKKQSRDAELRSFASRHSM